MTRPVTEIRQAFRETPDAPVYWELVETRYRDSTQVFLTVLCDGWHVVDFVYSPGSDRWFATGPTRQPVPEFVRAHLPAKVLALLPQAH